MDKMREEFEAWFFCTYHENKSKHHRAHVFAINPDGTYQCKDCERSWIGWVASRSALFVELPPQWFSRSYDEEVMSAIGVIDAINCSGVRYE